MGFSGWRRIGKQKSDWPPWRTHTVALRLTSKIEDMITMIFIPIYFTLSGLKTNIGLLSTGTAWGFVVMVVAVACAGKIIGCGVAARLGGLEWREAWGVGVLMNTSGLARGWLDETGG